MEHIKGLHIGNLIKQRLKENKRSKSWLAQEIDYDDSSLRKALENKHIHYDLLYNISVVLSENFFEYYTEKVKEKMAESS